MAAVALLVGCSQIDRTEEINPYGVRDAGEQVEVTLTLTVPSVEMADRTRVLTAADESTIERLDVLVFRSSGNDDTFAYACQATNLVQSGNSLTCTVLLRKSTAGEKYRLVMLANMPTGAVQDQITAGAVSIGLPRETVVNQFVFTAAAPWTSADPIPMWGRSSSTAAITMGLNPATLGAIRLMRAVARVNVACTDARFTLQSVRVCNSLNMGHVAPSSTNVTNNTATRPTVPAAAVAAAPYTVAAEGGAVTNQIYVVERWARPVGDADAFCLVAGGVFEGTECYYRIDPQLNGTPINLLRNFSYTITIDNVPGVGLPTADDAMNAVPLDNVRTNVVPWGEVNIDRFENTYLSVDRELIELPKESSTGNIIRFETNHTGLVSLHSDVDWITGLMLNGSTVTFDCATNDDLTQLSRTGTVTITAGKLSCRVTVTQMGPWYGPFSFTVDTSLASGSGVGSYRTNIEGAVLDGSSMAIDWGGEVTAVGAQTTYNEGSNNDYAPVGGAPAQAMVFPAGTNLNGLKATYSAAGEYTISIYSSLPPTVQQTPTIALGGNSSYVDCKKVRSLLSPMLNQGSSLENAFYGCSNLTGSIPADLFRYNTAATWLIPPRGA